jgi:HPt (histidine-containing phosphotransfer) domain-containing protein
MPRTEPIENVEIERSEFASDPEMRDIVTLFIDDLPRRAESLRSALLAGDRARLRMLAHQLRGSAGGYGFPALGNAAANVEILILSGAGDERIGGAVERLVHRCRAAASSHRLESRPIVFE